MLPTGGKTPLSQPPTAPHAQTSQEFLPYLAEGTEPGRSEVPPGQEQSWRCHCVPFPGHPRGTAVLHAGGAGRAGGRRPVVATPLSEGNNPSTPVLKTIPFKDLLRNTELSWFLILTQHPHWGGDVAVCAQMSLEGTSATSSHQHLPP